MPDKGAKVLQAEAAVKEKLQKKQRELDQLDIRINPPKAKSESPLWKQDEAKVLSSETPRVSESIKFDFKDIPLNPRESFVVNGLGKKALENLNQQKFLTHDKLEKLHGSLVSRPGEDEKCPDPPGLKSKLMGHQQHALAWLKWRETQKPRGGILGLLYKVL